MPTSPPDFGPRTFEFACAIVRLYLALIDIPRFPFRVANQLLDAGTSIGANIEEGRAPSSRKGLANHFKIALREARECKYWLRVLRATNLAPAHLTKDLLQEADELVAILTVSVRNLGNG